MCSGRRIMATRLSASVMRSYSSQSALRRRGVAGGGAEDATAGQAKRFRIAVARVHQLGLALEDEEARPPVGVRDEHGAARIAQEILELHPRLRDGDAYPAVARIDRHDAELRHAVPAEGGQHALRIVVDKLLDLGRKGSRHARSPQGFFVSVGRSMTRTAVPLTSESAGSTMTASVGLRPDTTSTVRP